MTLMSIPLIKTWSRRPPCSLTSQVGQQRYRFDPTPMSQNVKAAPGLILIKPVPFDADVLRLAMLGVCIAVGCGRTAPGRRVRSSSGKLFTGCPATTSARASWGRGKFVDARDKGRLDIRKPQKKLGSKSRGPCVRQKYIQTRTKRKKRSKGKKKERNRKRILKSNGHQQRPLRVFVSCFYFFVVSCVFLCFLCVSFFLSFFLPFYLTTLLP